MKPEPTQPFAEENRVNRLTEVTPLSKYLAMGLFIILPFISGWIGYKYAPDKIVEVEKVVEVERIENENDADTELNPALHASELPDGMALYRDVSSTYINLNLSDAEGSSSMPVILLGGDVNADSVLVSPDKKYVFFKGYECSRVLGGHCFGGFYVRDTKENPLSADQARSIELRGDEQAPYNLAHEPNTIAPGPLYQFGTFTGWDSENRLNFEMEYEGLTYKYRSVSSEEPWVLEYLGLDEQ